MPTLLVVDDEPSILHFFRRAFHEPEVTVLTAASAAESSSLAFAYDEAATATAGGVGNTVEPSGCTNARVSRSEVRLVPSTWSIGMSTPTFAIRVPGTRSSAQAIRCDAI